MGQDSNGYVLLIYPHPGKDIGLAYYPLSLVKLASGLKQANFSCRILDERIEPLTSEVLDQAWLVGLTMLPGLQTLRAVQVCKWIKSRRSEMPICLGGVHASLAYRAALAEPYVDYVLRGDGEAALVSLAARVSQGNVHVGHDADKDAVSDDAIHHESPDSVPIDWAVLDLQAYDTRTAYYESSRGCSGTCAFCAKRCIHGGQVRAKSRSVIHSELEGLFSRITPHRLNLTDSDPLCDRAGTGFKVIEWISSHVTGVQVVLNCPIRSLRRLSSDQWKVLANTPIRLRLDAVSFVPQTLRRMLVRHTVEEASEVGRLLSEHNVEHEWDLILGFPGETTDDVINMVQSAKRLCMNADINMHLYYPFVDIVDTPPCSAMSLEAWGRLNLDAPPQVWLDKKTMIVTRAIYYLNNMRATVPQARRRCREHGVGLRRWYGDLKPLLTRGALRRLAHLRWWHGVFAMPLEWEYVHMQIVQAHERAVTLIEAGVEAGAADNPGRTAHRLVRTRIGCAARSDQTCDSGELQ